MVEKRKETHKLFLIDDNDDHRFLIKKNLEKPGRFTFSVEEAESVEEAVDALAKKTFDIILLDLFLPEYEDGKDTLVEIKKEYETPVIVLTAYGDEDKVKELIDLGASDYIVKDLREGRLHLHKLKESIVAQVELYKRKMKFESIRKIAHKVETSKFFWFMSR